MNPTTAYFSTQDSNSIQFETSFVIQSNQIASIPTPTKEPNKVLQLKLA